MDFIKNQALKIREQLAGLSQSQRMLAGSLAVIMVMSLLWWGRYAGAPEMEDVLPQDLTPEQLNAVVLHVSTRGIPHKVVGARVQVAADRKLEALALLTYEQSMPQDTASGFDQIIAKMDSPWNTDKKQEEMFKRAKETTLAHIMRQWPGVRDAVVVINNAQRRAFGEAGVTPSAIVNLKMKQLGAGEKPQKRVIAAAADTVAGAVSGMQRSKVNVIIDGASYNAADKDDAGATTGGDTWMDLVREHERHFYAKIQDRLRNIDGVLVSVTVDPEMQVKQWEKEYFDKDKSVSKVAEETTREEENNSNSRPPAEPGAVPNTGAANQALSVTASGAGGGGGETTVNSTNETKTKYENFVARIREKINSAAGASAVVGASISVPRSHFVRIFKSVYPTAKEPDEVALKPLIDSELGKIRNAVLGCVSKTPDEKVLIDWYYDYLPTGDVGGQPAAATSLPLALTGHAKEIALGALAVVSLFMVSMMVRKGTPAPIIMPQAERMPPTEIPHTEDVAGEAMEGIQSMDAVEVDDNAVHTQQMIAQVSNLVKENPDAAAGLVKRWLNRA